MEKEADRFVILGGEQVAEGLENALTAQVDNLRHLRTINMKFCDQKQFLSQNSVPPLVRLVIAHAASFWALKSP